MNIRNFVISSLREFYKRLLGKFVKKGYQVVELGEYSHAEGYMTTAATDYAHAEGNQTIALGQESHAEGRTTHAEGMQSHAEGFNTHADGAVSHAEGYTTRALGVGSHAEGGVTTAVTAYSHAEGGNTIARNMFEHAEGIWNVSISQVTQHTVGIGTGSTYTKNAHTITTDGKHYIPGVGTYVGTETTLPVGQDLATILGGKATIDGDADKIMVLDQDEYDALPTKDPSTIYVVL